MAIRRRIRGLARKWHKKVGDTRLKLIFHWDDKYPLRAGAEVDEPYLSLHLYFNEKRVVEELKGEDELEQEILHEIVHALVWGYGKKLAELGCPAKELENLEEGLTTQIERGLWRAYISYRPWGSEALVPGPGLDTSTQ